MFFLANDHCGRDSAKATLFCVRMPDSDDAFFVLREEKSLAKVYEKNSYSVSFQFVKRKTARSEEFNNLEQLPRQARNDGRNRRSALLIRVQNGQDVVGRQRARVGLR